MARAADNDPPRRFDGQGRAASNGPVNDAGAARPTLTIVIPALNEEQSIGSIVERCLAAAPVLAADCGLSRVDIVVVSDGSTDRTAAIARGFEPRIRVIEFPRNRGYGAAIQEGWRTVGGDLLSFLDADGTCDPAHLGPMCRKAVEGTSVVLGNRMHGDSAMPFVRRVGNTLFAWLLGYLSSERVKDTASGMRVVRRDALPLLLPLPDGLHFTPAMSAVCMVHEDLTIAEIDMPYREREGRSKLRVVRDGFRFLGSILAAAAIFRPRRLALPLIALLAAVALWFAWEPVSLYARERRIEERHIYELLVVSVLGAVASLLFCATHLMEHLTAAAHQRLARYEAGTDRMASRGTFRVFAVVSVAAAVASVAFASPGIAEFFGSRTTTVHWSRFALASLATVVAAQFVVTAVLLRFVRALDRKVAALRGSE
ncbi:MAG: Undecaprenyl-phosphate 4-deoxy-4-formamido-L-arabinose transferase [Planctomycetes bacterium]|nr:Undecaprenyl-phosphate 4-deoxy-4-formamido-L-arabinose transferase [Planctomycetota bacterium]